MGEAAKISLKAIGKQDTYLLSKEPDESFFNYVEDKRHSEFRKYHRSKHVINPGQVANWPFNQTIKVQFEPKNMGDLLSNMWLSIKMPALNSPSNENYADQLGRHILKSITMHVDDIEVEKVYDDWGILYDELYLETSEKVANRFLVNRNLGFDASESNPNYAKFESDLVIPIHFFFSRKYASDEYSTNKPNRPYFPLCSIFNQKIIFELEFHKQTFFTDTTKTLELSSFDIITEEITLGGEERIFMMKEQQMLLTDLVRKHPTIITDEGKDVIRNNLTPNIPVKCIHWFFRNVKFENENIATGDPVPSEDGEYLMHNRFNFSSNVNFDETYSFFAPIMKSTSFYINGNKMPNISDTTHTYYKYLMPLQKRLSRPTRNIYTYSFSMNPVNVEPSGSLDFSQIQSDKTAIEVKLDTSLVNVDLDKFTLHMYYTGYQTFKFENGFMSIAY
jgi:hypothetical protein